MRLLRVGLIDATTVGAIDGAAKPVNDAIALTLDGFDVTLSAPVFRFLELSAAIAFVITVDTPAEWTYQNRRLAAIYQDHLPVKFGVRV